MPRLGRFNTTFFPSYKTPCYLQFLLAMRFSSIMASPSSSSSSSSCSSSCFLSVTVTARHSSYSVPQHIVFGAVRHQGVPCRSWFSARHQSYHLQ